MGSKQWDRRQDALGSLNMLSDEMLCKIIGMLSPRDVGNLACVSSLMYVFCNEEPLWMQLCLEKHEGLLDYKGTWRQTTLEKLSLIKSSQEYYQKSCHFEGFSSIFLYRRWYRCHVALGAFALDNGAVERRGGLTSEEFTAVYDGKKPVLLSDLMSDWPANKLWCVDELAKSCGEAAFKVSQPHGKSIDMTMKDFVKYMSIQHDEEPLYIFDAQFGESAPELLKDYKVPAVFSEDLFSVLSDSQRPPFRWFVLGPARSGASWHVDPSLTSAWNSLVSGRKRWALYPPGKVPPGVLLDVDEDDGSVHYDGPTSLQWWLDVYPHLADENKPLECTQLPGETIYVPSGWWHCVLNIDASVAVTHNFVNTTNFEIVCMDLSPGYRHRAVARAGVVALEGCSLSPENGRGVGREAQPIFKNVEAISQAPSGPTSKTGMRKGKRVANGNSRTSIVGGVTDENLLLALRSLKINSEERVDPAEWHLSERGNMSGSIMRNWLRKLWVARPELQPLVWKGACIAIDAGVWLQRINIICKSLGLPLPTDEEQLPIGDGSNPVYILGDNVIKIYIQEGGPDASIEGLGSELNFYAILKESGSSLQEIIPEFVASGILYPVGDDYKAVSWDGTGDCSLVYKDLQLGKKRQRDSPKHADLRVRTKWSANSYALKILKSSESESDDDEEEEEIKLWPYLITRRCAGTNWSQVIHDMEDEDLQSVASFLGEKVNLLHSLPLPTCVLAANTSDISTIVEQAKKQERKAGKSKGPKREHAAPTDTNKVMQSDGATNSAPALSSGCSDPPGGIPMKTGVSQEWQLFVSYMRKQRATLRERLRAWDSLPQELMDKVEAYLPADPVVLIGDLQLHSGVFDIARSPVWLHNDLMDDNILVEPARLDSVLCSSDGSSGQLSRTPLDNERRQIYKASYILDFGDLFLGDPLYEFVLVYMGAFHLKSSLMETFLKSYRLPLYSKHGSGGARYAQVSEGAERVQFLKLSYCAMCYTLLHELDQFSTIFRIRDDVQTSTSFEEIEEKIWGFLNEYSCDDHSM